MESSLVVGGDLRNEKLTDLVKAHYDNGDASHDWAHIMRVATTCLRIAPAAGAEGSIAVAAALLHDLVNLPKNHPERTYASHRAAEKSEECLKQAGYSADEIAHVKTVITEHSYSLGKKPSCIESAVLQDADRLDALGAIGIMRTVTCGSRMGATYYDVGDPFALRRDLDDQRFTLDHFYTKLFNLAQTFNTVEARQLASARTAYMKTFVEQLSFEIANAP